jgi:hypothetical protein
MTDVLTRDAYPRRPLGYHRLLTALRKDSL